MVLCVTISVMVTAGLQLLETYRATKMQTTQSKMVEGINALLIDKTPEEIPEGGGVAPEAQENTAEETPPVINAPSPLEPPLEYRITTCFETFERELDVKRNTKFERHVWKRYGDL